MLPPVWPVAPKIAYADIVGEVKLVFPASSLMFCQENRHDMLLIKYSKESLPCKDH